MNAPRRSSDRTALLSTTSKATILREKVKRRLREHQHVSNLPVNLQPHLHLPRAIGLVGHLAEVTGIQAGVARAEDSAVEDVERFAAQIYPRVLGDAERLGDAYVLGLV